MRLNYVVHTNSNGRQFNIAYVEDIAPNEGGLYCEVYNVNGDCLDNFCIHKGENPDEVAKAFMNEFYS